MQPLQPLMAAPPAPPWQGWDRAEPWAVLQEVAPARAQPGGFQALLCPTLWVGSPCGALAPALPGPCPSAVPGKDQGPGRETPAARAERWPWAPRGSSRGQLIQREGINRGSDCRGPRTHLFQFVNDHRKSFEDGVGGSREGDDPLGAVPFRDVDASSALQGGKRHLSAPAARSSSGFLRIPRCRRWGQSPPSSSSSSPPSARAAIFSSSASCRACPHLPAFPAPPLRPPPPRCLRSPRKAPRSLPLLPQPPRTHLLTHLLHGLPFL